MTSDDPANPHANDLSPHAAAPGTYGLAPRGFRLPETTTLGAVRLQVGDLGRSVAFYEDVLGLRILDRTPTSARLGAQPRPPAAAGASHEIGTSAPGALLELVEHAGARPAPPRGRTGLFHFAILLPDRASLGRFVAHAGDSGLRLGAGDHYVSESLYLSDPDGLGIEVYADRPRETWRRVGRQLVMGTDPVDMRSLLGAADGEPWTGMPEGTLIGHLHLHVGDLDRGAAFYGDGVGFDRMVWDYPGALFFGAGGYHHHLGTNVWAGADARPAAPDEAQLLEWTIALPDAASLAALHVSLDRGGYAADRPAESPAGGAILTRDPWGTPLRLTIRGAFG